MSVINSRPYSPFNEMLRRAAAGLPSEEEEAAALASKRSPHLKSNLGVPGRPAKGRPPPDYNCGDDLRAATATATAAADPALPSSSRAATPAPSAEQLPRVYPPYESLETFNLEPLSYPTAEQHVPTVTGTHAACLLSPRLSPPPQHPPPPYEDGGGCGGAGRPYAWQQSGAARPPSRSTPTPPASRPFSAASTAARCDTPLRSVSPGVHSHRRERYARLGEVKKLARERAGGGGERGAALHGGVGQAYTSPESQRFLYAGFLKMHTDGLREFDSLASMTECVLEKVKAAVGQEGEEEEERSESPGADAAASPTLARGASEDSADGSPMASAQMPHPLLTAAAAALFQRIVSKLTSYRGVLTKLLDELLRAIYVDYTPGCSEADLIGLNTYSSIAKQASDEADKQMKRVKMMSVSQRTCGRVLSQTVGKWQEVSVRFILKSWWNVSRRRQRREVSTGTVLKSGVDRRTKLLFFYKWKSVTMGSTQRRFVRTSTCNTEALGKWLDDVKVQLRAREEEAAKLKEQRATQRKKMDALLNLINEERDASATHRTALRAAEGRLCNAVDLPLSTLVEVEKMLRDYTRPSIDSFQQQGLIVPFRPVPSQHNPPLANPEDILAYHVDSLEAFFASFLSTIFPQHKALTKANFYAELRTLKHLLSLALLVTDTANVTPEKLSDSERLRWYHMLHAELGGGRGLSTHALSSLSDPALLASLCTLFLRYTQYNPRRKLTGAAAAAQKAAAAAAATAAAEEAAAVEDTRDELRSPNDYSLPSDAAQVMRGAKGGKPKRGTLDVAAVTARRTDLLLALQEKKRWAALGSSVANLGATALNREAAELHDGTRVRVREQEVKASLHALGVQHGPTTGAEVVAAAKFHQLALNREHPLLTRVYSYYKYGSLRFGVDEWLSLCGDARLLVKPLTSEACERVFEHVASTEPVCRSRLSYKLFARCVSLMAFYAHQTNTLSNKLKLTTMLSKLSACRQTDTFYLQGLLADDKVCEVLKEQREVLKRAFAKFATVGSKPCVTTEGADLFLTAVSCPQALRDMKTVLFNTVIHATTTVAPGQATDYELQPATFSFKQFTHLVTVIALSYSTNPLQPPYQRLHHYLLTQLPLYL